MPLVDLRRDGDVFVLTMRAGENRFNRASVNALNEALDTVEASSGPAALVTTGEEKFFSNGLDLTWMAGDGSSEGGRFVVDVMRLLGRFLVLSVPTVAAVNGHAFAAGGMLALAHDWRVMRADRGFFCLPEIDIQFPLAPGMTALIACKLSPLVFRDAILTGARIGGTDAQTIGIVDEAVAADDVLPRAIARATALASKDRATYGALKRGMYGTAHDALAGGALGAAEDRASSRA
ncbi:MAG: enoyl-CoA hydratase/isomerase family protein [Deltaproteobacteria bacterium]|nr:MAG: enoyl-CoA hydratase/isomerase family protein [Deltaproteobacteria bacterium]